MSRAMGYENVGAFSQGRARGADVIDQQQTLANNDPGGCGQRKGAAEVPPPRHARQTGLGPGRAVTDEEIAADRPPPLGEKQQREQQRLVETAPLETAGMERYWDNQIAIIIRVKVTSADNFRQSWQDRAVGAVFQTVDQSRDWLLMQTEGAARRLALFTGAAVNYRRQAIRAQSCGRRPMANAAAFRQK